MPKARPVSLYPLDFDTALRALLKVPKKEIDRQLEENRRQRSRKRRARRLPVKP